MIPRTLLFLLTGRPGFEKVDKSDPKSIFRVTKGTFRNWLDDSDYNMHMNNQFLLFLFVTDGRSYQKICDIKRTGHTHKLAPVTALRVLKSQYLIGHAASSLRFLHEIPVFATYYVYTRFLTWSPDGLHLYYQTIFTIKGRKKSRTVEDKVFKEIPSIIPDDEIICAISYVRNQIISANGKRMNLEEILKDEGYDPYNERVQKIKDEGWEYVKDLHVAWDKEMALAGLRQLGTRL